MKQKKNRREFIKGLAGASVSPIFFIHREPIQLGRFPISCNNYDWVTFYKRQGKVWWEDPAASAADFASAGLKAIEPNIGSPEEAKEMVQVLKTHDIQMPSVYVNSLLHNREKAAKSIDLVLSIASVVKAYDTKIMVTNPSPIEWGGKAVKSDAELVEQAGNLDRLGAALKDVGLTLAYHTHDTEMLAGAREFHHMMQNTSPAHVAYCFDVHWIYRGSMNSHVAVFDVLKLYGSRVIELHIRQSKDGVWTETFGDGDIDYQRLVRDLKERKLRPHVVIEQCVEAGTPNTMNAVQAHKIDLDRIQETFRDIL